jgi:DNA-binding Lrp family transcriptional regulator
MGGSVSGARYPVKEHRLLDFLKQISYVPESAMDRAWTFFASHGLALMQVARDPHARIRDIAAALGITERAAQGIVGDLVREGYLERVREGRRNRYLVRGDRPLRHRTTRAHTVAELIHALALEPPRDEAEGCEAIVVACSDYRMQGWLRSLLADQRLLDRAELVLWPGGGALLAGSRRGDAFEVLERLVGDRGPARLLLVAHTGCEVPGVRRARGSPLEAYRSIQRRQRRIIVECRRRLRMEPELWLVDPGRFSRVRVGLPKRAGDARRPLAVAG